MKTDYKNIVIGALLVVTVVLLVTQSGQPQNVMHQDMHGMMNNMLGGHFEEKHHEELHKYLMEKDMCSQADCPMMSDMQGSMGGI